MPTNEQKNPGNQESPRTLTDDQIITERQFSRRSFLTATGALLAGGALAILSDGRARALQTTPQSDPDSKKGSDPDKKKNGKKGSDPDKKKRGKKSSDPDKKKAKKKPSTADPDPR